MQIRPTASAYGLIINFSIALFHVYTEFGIDSSEHTSCFQDAKYYKRSNTFSSLKSTLEKYYEYLTDDK